MKRFVARARGKGLAGHRHARRPHRPQGGSRGRANDLRHQACRRRGGPRRPPAPPKVLWQSCNPVGPLGPGPRKGFFPSGKEHSQSGPINEAAAYWLCEAASIGAHESGSATASQDKRQMSLVPDEWERKQPHTKPRPPWGDRTGLKGGTHLGCLSRSSDSSLIG